MRAIGATAFLLPAIPSNYLGCFEYSIDRTR